MYYTFHLLLQSGIGESHGRDTGRLVAGLMGSLSDLEHDSEVFDLAKQALDHGADPNDIEAIAEHMARLGIGDATVLRALAVAAREPT